MEAILEDIERVPTTITACCVLHNICVSIEFGDDTPIQAANYNDQGDPPAPGHHINANGMQLRDTIKGYLDKF